MERAVLYFLINKVLKQSFYFVFELSFVGRTYVFVNQLTIFEEQQSRDVANTVFATDFVTLVNIIFTNSYLTFVLSSKLVNKRTNLTARTAPLCPEVNYYGFTRCDKFLCQFVSEFKCHSISILVLIIIIF